MIRNRAIIIVSSVSGGTLLGYAITAVDGAILGAFVGLIVGLADWNEN